ncbi:hypothetical protein HK405_004687, partial [Cladochytrium tenue]
MPVLRLFREFAVDFWRNRLKLFEVERAWCFLLRAVEAAAPAGVWWLLVTHAPDLRAAHTELGPFASRLWALSILAGPFTAGSLVGLHTVPLFSDPLTSGQCLLIKATADLVALLAWIAFAVATPLVITERKASCGDSPVAKENNGTVFYYADQTLSQGGSGSSCVPHTEL